MLLVILLLKYLCLNVTLLKKQRNILTIINPTNYIQEKSAFYILFLTGNWFYSSGMKRNREPVDFPAPKNLLHDNASQDNNYQGYRLLMFDSDDDFNFRSDGAPSSSSSSQQTYFNDPSSTLRSALDSFLATSEPSLAATLVMQYDDIKHEILKMLYSNVHNQFKTSLKKSKLITTKKDRKYLLKLNPTDLCQEFNDNANLAFQFLTKGLLGLTNEQAIFESQILLNKIYHFFSLVSSMLQSCSWSHAWPIDNPSLFI